MSTINPQISPRHETTGITKQENSRPTILIRIAQPSQHIRIRPILLPLWKRLEQTSSHSRDDIPRRDGVDSNPMLTPLSSQVPRQLKDTRFRSIIRPIQPLLAAISTRF